MGMDRNTVIGFVLLGILLFLYIFFSSRDSQQAMQRKHYEDSLAAANLDKQMPVNKKSDTATASVTAMDTTGFNKATNGTEQVVTVETDLMRIDFTNKGAQPKAVYLKKYLNYDSMPVKLVSDADEISYNIITGTNQSSSITNLYFTPSGGTKNSDGSQTVNFQLVGP